MPQTVHFLGELLSNVASIQPAGELHIHLGRPLECILLFLGLELGYHPDQLHLAEFAAVKAREKLFHIDLDIDARNTVVQAELACGFKTKSMTLQV